MEKIHSFSLKTLNISWTSLEADAILEFSNYVSENMHRINIAGCRKLLTDESKRSILFWFSICRSKR